MYRLPLIMSHNIPCEQCECFVKAVTAQTTPRPHLCNDLQPTAEQSLGSGVVHCLWGIVGHGVVAHQDEVILQGRTVTLSGQNL